MVFQVINGRSRWRIGAPYRKKRARSDGVQHGKVPVLALESSDLVLEDVHEVVAQKTKHRKVPAPALENTDLVLEDVHETAAQKSEHHDSEFAARKCHRASRRKRPRQVQMKTVADLQLMLMSLRAIVGGVVLLDLFSGTGVVTHCAQELGMSAFAVDILDGYDITIPAMLEVLLLAITQGVFAAVWIACPCNSFSLARRGRRKPGQLRGYPMKVRSPEHVAGLPGLAGRTLYVVQNGNRCAAATAAVIKACVLAHVPVGLENPCGSYLWRMPDILEVSSLESCLVVHLDFCQFGAPWRKPTKVLLWGVPGEKLHHLRKVCKPKRNGKGLPTICSRTCCNHTSLKNGIPRHGCPYPHDLGVAIVEVLIS